VLAVVALAVLSGIDGANYSSARERARATAGALAEKDQERMRSIKFDKLADPGQPYTVNVDNVDYLVTPKAQWITDDANATPVCGDSGAQAEYLRISSTVTSNIIGVRTAPVTIESMIAPSVTYAQGHGTLAVKVVAGKTARAAGLTVTAIPKTAGTQLTATTNSEGCALFRSIAKGDYTMRLNTLGYMDKAGNQQSDLGATVSPNFLTVITMPYDKATNMAVSVATLKPGTKISATATRYPSKADAVSDNSASGTNVVRTFAKSDNSKFTSINTGPIFPFATAYQFYTGDCAYESPVKAWTGNASYFTDDATKGASLIGDPDAFQPQPVTAFQPAFNLRVRADYDTPSPSDQTKFDASAAGLTAYVTLQRGSDTCNDITGRQMLIKDWPTAGWDPAPTLTKNWVVQNSTDWDPGMPFGKYTVCLVDSTSTTKQYWSTTYDNTNPSSNVNASGVPTTVEIPGTAVAKSNWSTTSCVNG